MFDKSINKCQFIGLIGKEPEVTYTPTDQAVMSFSLAVKETWSSKGSRKRSEKTQWIPLVIWNPKLIDLCKEYLHSGMRIYVECKFNVRSWENNGKKHYKNEFIVAQIQVLSNKKTGDDSAGQSGYSGGDAAEGNYSEPDYGEQSPEEQDVPF